MKSMYTTDFFYLHDLNEGTILPPLYYEWFDSGILSPSLFSSKIQQEWCNTLELLERDEFSSMEEIVAHLIYGFGLLLKGPQRIIGNTWIRYLVMPRNLIPFLRFVYLQEHQPNRSNDVHIGCSNALIIEQESEKDIVTIFRKRCFWWMHTFLAISSGSERCWSFLKRTEASSCSSQNTFTVTNWYWKALGTWSRFLFWPCYKQQLIYINLVGLQLARCVSMT